MQVFPQTDKSDFINSLQAEPVSGDKATNNAAEIQVNLLLSFWLQGFEETLNRK
jgi:hypothetical protein